LPLRKEEWVNYLNWAVKAFRISASGVNDDTQIHTHMCYSEFNEIGPGIYDIHSPRVASSTEMVRLLEKASAVIPVDQLWVNPDCGLKTRHWDETKKALIEMVAAAQEMRAAVESPVN